MFYIIGSERERRAWEDGRNVPYFECEEKLDAETVCLHDHEDGAATLFVNLKAEPRYTVQVSGEEGVESEEDYGTYEEAIAAYEAAR